MSDTRQDTRTIQLWPDGASITYSGDYGESSRTLHVWPRDWEGHDPAWRQATPEEHRAIRINERAAMYLERDVHQNMTGLVDECRKLQYEGRGDLAEAFSDENIANLYPDTDNLVPVECREWLEEHGHAAPDCDNCHNTGIVDDDACNACEDDCRDAVRDHAEPAEIYEWYLVSSWLARQLASIGECVLDSGYGHFWGRTCSGQAVIMDGTLQRVAVNFEGV